MGFLPLSFDRYTPLKKAVLIPMYKVTTAQILAEKALDDVCGQNCVDWAVGMLTEGRDGNCLAMLASMGPPFNYFEVAELRDRALKELNVPDLPSDQVIKVYAAERLRAALDGREEVVDVLETLKDLCIDTDHDASIFDFYLLYWAYVDLQMSEVQWYWKGATRENIDRIIEKRMEQFLAEQPRITLDGV